MKAALKTSAKNSVENQERQFNFTWNPNSDSASLKTWEEENEEYASWTLIEDKNTATC